MDYKSQNNILIGLKGKIGSGKTTSAEILKEEFTIEEYVMAGPIKKIGSIMGFTDTELYGTQEEKLKKNPYWGISARHFLQIFGTDICRDALSEKIPAMYSIWLQLFEIHMNKNKSTNILVSDIRFPDEADAIQKNGGIIIEIDRTPDEPQDSDWENIKHHTQHASEMDMEKIKANYVISNTKDISYLRSELIKVVNKHYLK